MKLNNNRIFIIVIGIVIVVQASIVLVVALTRQNATIQQFRNDLKEKRDSIIFNVDRVIKVFEYNIIRTSSVIKNLDNNTFVSQTFFDNIIRVDANPIVSEFEQFLWTPIIPISKRAQFELFGQQHLKPSFQITEFNGTHLVPAQNRSEYIPFTVFSPINVNLTVLIGFDGLSLPSLHTLFSEETRFVLTNVNIQSRENTNTGLLFGDKTFFNTNPNVLRGYNFGIIDFKA